MPVTIASVCMVVALKYFNMVLGLFKASLIQTTRSQHNLPYSNNMADRHGTVETAKNATNKDTTTRDPNTTERSSDIEEILLVNRVDMPAMANIVYGGNMNRFAPLLELDVAPHESAPPAQETEQASERSRSLRHRYGRYWERAVREMYERYDRRDMEREGVTEEESIAEMFFMMQRSNIYAAENVWLFNETDLPDMETVVPAENVETKDRLFDLFALEDQAEFLDTTRQQRLPEEVRLRMLLSDSVLPSSMCEECGIERTVLTDDLEQRRAAYQASLADPEAVERDEDILLVNRIDVPAMASVVYGGNTDPAEAVVEGEADESKILDEDRGRSHSVGRSSSCRC